MKLQCGNTWCYNYVLWIMNYSLCQKKQTLNLKFFVAPLGEGGHRKFRIKCTFLLAQNVESKIRHQKTRMKLNWYYEDITDTFFIIQLQFKVCYNRYSWVAGKQGSEYISWFRRLECISRRFLTMQIFVQIRLKMEAGDWLPLNINAMRAISVKSYLKATTGGTWSSSSQAFIWSTFPRDY